MSQYVDRQQDLGDTAFHIVDAGATHDVADVLEGHLVQGTEGPHRIVVPQHQLRGHPAGTTRRRGEEHSAAGPPADTPDPEIPGEEFFADDLPDMLLGVGFDRRRLGQRHPLEQANETPPPSRHQLPYLCRRRERHNDHFRMPAGNGNDSVSRTLAKRPG